MMRIDLILCIRALYTSKYNTNPGLVVLRLSIKLSSAYSYVVHLNKIWLLRILVHI